MSKINILSFEIANLIAAGEVVERPSSVLKELIENSIDSGADKIIAEIKKGGVALIRVSDNGCGIEAEDLPIALKRHATSKIKEREDLDSIMTLGFRGEALAAISSVSEMTIISKTRTSDTATMLTAVGGKVVDISEVGASDGTTVVVENLFGNVPARRKFLKKDSTEAMNVSALVEKVAVSHPEISIQLLIDGEEKFKTPGDGDLYNAIYSVFGKDFASKLIKVDAAANGITVKGYIGRSDNVKKNRNLQNFFINGRYVKSMTAMAAIEKAYTSYIAQECFPTCVLFITMNPSYVDVNVHPAKLEVKFTDERSVFETVYYTVKTALEEHEYRPELILYQKKDERNYTGAFVPIGTSVKPEQVKFSSQGIGTKTPLSYSRTSLQNNQNKPQIISEFKNEYDRPYNLASPLKDNSSGTIIPRPVKDTTQYLSPKDSVELLEKYSRAEKNEEIETVTDTAREVIVPEHRIIGEAFDCYILVEYEGALLVIDKHAAHERIIFEDLKRINTKNGRVASQSLLLPITVILSPEEIAVAEEYKEDIEKLGFEYYVNGGGCDLTAIPDAIGTADAETLIIKMLDDIIEGKGDPKFTDDIRKEKALYQIACKGAIKGGRAYNASVRDWIVAKVLCLPDITVCPHGRPIAYKLTKNELDRQFERIK